MLLHRVFTLDVLADDEKVNVGETGRDGWPRLDVYAVHEEVQLVSDHNVAGKLARGGHLGFDVALDGNSVALDGSYDVVHLASVDHARVGFDDLEVDGDPGETGQ